MKTPLTTTREPESPRSSRSVLVVSIGAAKCHVSVLPLHGWETAKPRQVSFALEGVVSQKKVKQALRELGWRMQRDDPCFAVLPSEEILLLVEEFPTTDSDEVRTMAEGIVQGMVELDPKEHILLIHVLHRGSSSIVCALAIFARKRLQKILETIQRLGIKNPRFALDLMGLWQISGDVVSDGFWGRIVKDENSRRVVVKGLKVANGVIRTVRQRFYYREEVDENWITTLGRELFPEDFQAGDEPAITWYISHRSVELPTYTVPLCRLAASGRLIDFELQSEFWEEHLSQQRQHRRFIGLGVLGASLYLMLLLYLAGLSLWQWHDAKQQKDLLQDQESAFKEAMEVKRDLERVHASLNPTGNVLEVLRWVGEQMSEGLTLESFTYRFQDSVKLRGIAKQEQKDAVYDFVSKLRTDAFFKNTKIDSMNDNPSGGGVTWQVVVPLQRSSSS